VVLLLLLLLLLLSLAHLEQLLRPHRASGRQRVRLQLLPRLLHALRCSQCLRLLLVHQQLQIHTRCYLLLQGQLRQLLRNRVAAYPSSSCCSSNSLIWELQLQLVVASNSGKQLRFRRITPAARAEAALAATVAGSSSSSFQLQVEV
jgi:hypothetical protein